MEFASLVPALFPLLVTAGIATAYAVDQQRRARAVKQLELEPSDDWSLQGRAMWDDTSEFAWTLAGGSPAIGTLSWTHETSRHGRPLLVARERLGTGKSSTYFYLAVARTLSVRWSWFTNGGNVAGDLPEAVRTHLVELVDARVARSTAVHDGFVVIRVRALDLVDEAIASALWVADELDATTIGSTPAPAPPTSWEQPPRGARLT